MRVSFSMTATLRMPRAVVLDERDISGSGDTGLMRGSGDDYWRSRAGVPAVKGVLAPQAGSPGVAPLPAVADLLRHVWIPRWNLPPGVVVEQGVLEYPSANLVIEADAAALYGPELGRGVQRLEGT